MTSPCSNNIVPKDFDARFQRAFGLLAFSVNRHLVDHMRRICIELSMDLEMAQIWGTLAHMNVLPNLPLGANPMVLLDEMGRGKDVTLAPVRLAQLSQVTGLPRETVRRKLESLRCMGKVERDSSGRWLYKDAGITEAEVEFTRRTVLQFLNTAQTLLTILDQVKVDQIPVEPRKD
jgi:DNA-binding transcriptional ArsR family regulator